MVESKLVVVIVYITRTAWDWSSGCWVTIEPFSFPPYHTYLCFEHHVKLTINAAHSRQDSGDIDERGKQLEQHTRDVSCLTLYNYPQKKVIYTSIYIYIITSILDMEGKKKGLIIIKSSQIFLHSFFIFIIFCLFFSLLVDKCSISRLRDEQIWPTRMCIYTYICGSGAHDTWQWLGTMVHPPPKWPASQPAHQINILGEKLGRTTPSIHGLQGITKRSNS